MKQGRCVLALVLALLLPAVCSSALITDPPRPITHRVSVRIIQTALDNGSSPATVFGNATQRAEIEAAVDAIWAQAGIDIQFLNPIVRYNDTFAYQGISGALPRPAEDFNLIMAEATLAGGILHPQPSTVNAFFTEIVPGFGPHHENWAGGLANLGTSGLAISIGETLLTTENGRDSAGTMIAHEIAHNLGLRHVPNGSANLMAASQRTSAQLTSDQVEAIFQTQFLSNDIAYIPHGGTGFPQLIMGFITGDYNRNGVVDLADYAMWRDTLGSTGFLAADGNGNKIVDVQDYAVWKSNFGRTAAFGQMLSPPVPEPAAIIYVAAAAVAYFIGRRARRR
jgi:hypothetical protein